MAGILWKRICEEYGRICIVLLWCDMMFMSFGLDDEPLADVIVFGVIFLALIAAMIITGISSEPIKGVFIAPFSKEDRRRLVVRMFYGKMAVGMGVMTAALTAAVLLGTITLVNWLTMFIISLSMAYMMSFRRFDKVHNPSMEVLEYVLVIADVIVFIGACDNEFLFFGKNSGAALLIIAVILAAVHYFVWRRYFEPLVECYSDYERMTEVSKKIRSNS